MSKQLANIDFFELLLPFISKFPVTKQQILNAAGSYNEFSVEPWSYIIC